MSELKDLQRLYDQNRFLEAFRKSAHFWVSPANLDVFSSDELILGARLASRLGGLRLSRWLYRAANAREPTSPRARYFANGVGRGHRSFLDELRDREANPTLDTDDVELQASWLASNACIWASLRDFSRAHDGIERARALHCMDGWVSSCESNVLGMEDRWEEALEAAELSWKINPGSPFGAHSLGASLLNLGRVEEAAKRLESAAEASESFEVVAAAIWQQAALADTLEGEERRHIAKRAQGLADRIPNLAPLADREFRSQFAHLRLDLAQLADDHEEMERWAKEARVPFFHRVLENLRKNPHGSRVRLPYRREMQKHMTCLPASLASCLAGMDVPMDANVMAAEVTFEGTSDWAAADWLESRGLEVRFFVVTPELAGSLIRNGIPFVLSLEGEDFSHAVAVVGLDEAAGTLLIHDPKQFRTVEYLLAAVGQQAPLGPKGMAAVPAEKRALLDGLLPIADVEVMAGARWHSRALQLQGPTVASLFVTEMAARHPSHPVTRLSQAIQAFEEGRAGEALAGFQELLQAFPGSPPLRIRLLHASQSLGNTALYRDTLESVVERGLLPGVQSQQAWQHAPSAYVWRYADLLRLSAATTKRARVLLHSAIRRESANADVWHVLADLLWHERDLEGALLSYRIASSLAESNDHYARAYSESLDALGRADEGLSWLEKRVRAYGDSSRAIRTWTTWIGVLESWGRPEQALEASREALQKHGSSAELLSFVVPFFARMGHWEESAGLLGCLEASGNPALFHQAACAFHGMKAELDESIRHAEASVRELPLDMQARGVLLAQLGVRDGPPAALERARCFLAERPGHEDLELLYCTHLDGNNEPWWKKAMLLRRRLKRNPDDAWAWRELASGYVDAYRCADAKRQAKLRPRVVSSIAECERTAPDAAATLRVTATWLEARGEWRDAAALWLESIDRDPGTLDGYRRAWECSAAFDREERVRVWERMETMASGSPRTPPDGARRYSPRRRQIRRRLRRGSRFEMEGDSSGRPGAHGSRGRSPPRLRARALRRRACARDAETRGRAVSVSPGAPVFAPQCLSRAWKDR